MTSSDPQLWLLNSDSLIAPLSATLSPTVRGDAVTSPSHRQCSERQSPTKAGSAVNVLYLPCSPSGSTHQDVVDTWEKDIGVHPLDMPQTTCQELLSVLTASTSCLPPSLHSMNSYQVRGPLGNVGRASPLDRRSMTLFDSVLLLSIIYSLCLVAIVAPIFFKLIFEKRSRGIFRFFRRRYSTANTVGQSNLLVHTKTVFSTVQKGRVFLHQGKTRRCKLC
uniref:E3 ubiquitin-protein ligase E3D n=1 Tax=Hucho hucho TaxID=62062 RepID=A0A4W5RQT5_9TELE